MSVSLKCQYGLRALFELGKRKGSGPVRIQEIAAAQVIPSRFLENILNQLRQGGFVDSRRGKAGGFVLARPAEQITILDIIQFLEGPLYTFDCEGIDPIRKCPLGPNCVFMPLWRRAREALEAIYRETSLQDLLNAETPPHNFDI
jgi:Rrf2 family protein